MFILYVVCNIIKCTVVKLSECNVIEINIHFFFCRLFKKMGAYLFYLPLVSTYVLVPAESWYKRSFPDHSSAVYHYQLAERV